jgi:hypothetical protein
MSFLNKAMRTGLPSTMVLLFFSINFEVSIAKAMLVSILGLFRPVQELTDSYFSEFLYKCYNIQSELKFREPKSLSFIK